MTTTACTLQHVCATYLDWHIATALPAALTRYAVLTAAISVYWLPLDGRRVAPDGTYCLSKHDAAPAAAGAPSINSLPVPLILNISIPLIVALRFASSFALSSRYLLPTTQQLTNINQ